MDSAVGSWAVYLQEQLDAERAVTEELRRQVLAVERKLAASRFVCGERERELLEIQGPCSRQSCRLHYAHAGPCREKEC